MENSRSWYSATDISAQLADEVQDKVVEKVTEYFSSAIQIGNSAADILVDRALIFR